MRKIVILIIFIIFMSIASVSADDMNETDSDYSKADSECCSFIIQEKDETVCAFRQDTSLDGYGVYIHNDTWDDEEIIREEIDLEGSYFTHLVLTQNGWVFSQGGSQYNDNNRIIEKSVREIIKSDNISEASFGEIQDVLKKYKYGHVLIKAPDGRYGLAYYNAFFSGTLQPGEFLTAPNIYHFIIHGNYTDYGVDPVDAIINICSYENSGWNRRNLYIYDYKAYDTDNGQKYGANIYVTNDNGYNVGLNTSNLSSYFMFNDDYYTRDKVPEIPIRLYVANYIFNNKTLDSVFEIMNHENNILVNQETSINYRINNINDEKTAVFEIDDNVEFINAEVSQGKYYYDLNQHTLYWNLSQSNISKNINLTIKPKTKGNYTIHSYIQDMDEINITGYATDYGVSLKSDNVTTYKTYYASMNVYLNDNDGNPLIGEIVVITINNDTYYRKVTPKGYAALSIMMQPGEYEALVSYDGKLGKNQSTSKIFVNKTLFSNDLEFFYGEVSEFNVSALNYTGSILSNFEVDFSLDGVLKDFKTNNDGICSLNTSKLKPGKHSVISYNGATNEFVNNTIYVKSISSNDIIKIFKNNTQYYAKFVDGNGTLLNHSYISFKINGVTYTRTTDENGTAKLNINLGEGTYKLTAINPITGDIETNNITVIGLLETSNLTKYYKNDSQFIVRVLTPNGSYAGAGEEVKFNINGIFYTRTTNATGHAKLNINLIPGNYTITTYYKDYSQGNNIEVLPVLFVSDLNMKYHDGSKFEARLIDNTGNPYANQNITFNINGVFYNRTTDALGISKLNINLIKGEYIITSSYNGLNVANKITIT